jgi:hypothetical protein
MQTKGKPVQEVSGERRMLDAMLGAPSLTSIAGIGTDQLTSIFTASMLYHDARPWKYIDNSFPLRVSVRFTSTSNDFTPEAVMRYRKPAESAWNAKIRLLTSFPPEKSANPSDTGLTKHVIVAGNTDYNGNARIANVKIAVSTLVHESLPESAPVSTNIRAEHAPPSEP